MNYKDIGNRIRKFRKLKNLSQEELAEKVEISVPHMSHIETGNTKLSLQVLVDLSIALEVTTDDLIFEENNQIKIKKINKIIQSCTENQIQFLSEIIQTAKKGFDEYL